MGRGTAPKCGGGALLSQKAPPPCCAWSPSPRASLAGRTGTRLRELEVDGAGLAAAVGLELVGDALVAVERLEPGRLHGGDVDEGVAAAGLGLDEAVALVGVEEFDGSGDHDLVPSGGGPP